MSIGATGRSLVWFVIGVVLAAGLGLLAARWRAPAPETNVLRSYDVRPEIANELDSALRAALSPNIGFQYGRVTLSPSGQLLVIAPPSIQKGVEQILKEVAAREPPRTPSIHFEAWLVTASPGTPADSPNLKEIEPALHALEQSKGPARFELLEKLSTQTRSGQESSVQGDHALVSVTGSLLRGNKDQPIIAALLSLNMHSSSHAPHGPPPFIKAQTELRPGELLVLGQSNWSDGPDADRALYYIVRATL
jgi:hypothetical protein